MTSSTGTSAGSRYLKEFCNLRANHVYSEVLKSRTILKMHSCVKKPELVSRVTGLQLCKYNNEIVSWERERERDRERAGERERERERGREREL